MVKIRIFLDKKEISTPGIVSGHVYINCEEPIKARKVTLAIYGSAKTSWEDVKHHGNHHTTTKYYRSEQVYLNNQIIIWQRRSETERLPAGEMFLNFAFQIDHVLPPSFESQYGKIRYSLEAIIDRPYWPDTLTKIFFYPSPCFNLNYNPAAFKAIKFGKDSEVSSCCKNEKIDMTVSLSKSGYAIGEKVYFKLDVNNWSQRNVYKLKIDLVQVVECSAKRDFSSSTEVEFKQYTDLIKRFRDPIFVPSSTSSTSKHCFRISDVTPTFNEDICKIIEVKHFLKIRLYVEGTFTDNEVISSHPIIIGTIPTVKKSDTTATESQTNPFGSS